MSRGLTAGERGGEGEREGEGERRERKRERGGEIWYTPTADYTFNIHAQNTHILHTQV